ncbi:MULTISPECIES: hypothetical protein [Pseudomonas]|nr:MULTISPECIES: hypothetical protein [unclassified Pseudomonas]CRM29601.1 hypothetical protein [Pseudomonas sp. 58 R 12]CRM45122.1 hypothetical protein [Pseudomonas sp. 24 R 17]CRM49926.1 hypothetical protein [Pseudomonas sp. 52 E 6]CRM85981.1 hypothetical protein [Pseudomonas sp. 35 E 8]
MTNSTTPHPWYAMFAERMYGPRAAGVCLVVVALLVNQARAEDCRMTLSEPRVDYGVIRPSQTSSGRSTLRLDTQRTLHLSVLCANPAAMALRFSGAPADAQGFQFGRQGRFMLSLRRAQVDGRPVAWQTDETADGRLLPGRTLVASAAGVPMMGRRLTAQVEVEVHLPADALSVRREVLLEGHGQFVLVSPTVP